MSAPSTSRKYYVVWEGRAPGVYDSWEECEEQVTGFPGARYRAYRYQDDAVRAFRDGPGSDLDIIRKIATHRTENVNYAAFPEIRLDALAVDGACSRNPGPMEYRGVWVSTGEELFRVGPLDEGTNNIGEYLAIIHAAALLGSQGLGHIPIYSDSRTAQAWIRAGHSRTTVRRNARNGRLMDILDRANAWIASHRITNPILKWDTERWGEIPADFGRK
ncbi:MAG: ribonuclease H family protein [Muribaculaceae bacterium]|nr:ribonuclease H family protein [Muribaculaceae bacterium]